MGNGTDYVAYSNGNLYRPTHTRTMTGNFYKPREVVHQDPPICLRPYPATPTRTLKSNNFFQEPQMHPFHPENSNRHMMNPFYDANSIESYPSTERKYRKS